MLVRFLVDFRGVLTAEQFFLVGSQADFETATAEQLIADGRAVAVSRTEGKGLRTEGDLSQAGLVSLNTALSPQSSATQSLERLPAKKRAR